MKAIGIEREMLLEGLDEAILQRDENVTASLVLSVVATIMLVLFMFVPKVYLSNNIYKTSIEVSNLKQEYLSLKDENNILKNKIATLKYKNGLTH